MFSRALGRCPFSILSIFSWLCVPYAFGTSWKVACLFVGFFSIATTGDIGRSWWGSPADRFWMNWNRHSSIVQTFHSVLIVERSPRRVKCTIPRQFDLNSNEFLQFVPLLIVSVMLSPKFFLFLSSNRDKCFSFYIFWANSQVFFTSGLDLLRTVSITFVQDKWIRFPSHAKTPRPYYFTKWYKNVLWKVVSQSKTWNVEDSIIPYNILCLLLLLQSGESLW